MKKIIKSLIIVILTILLSITGEIIWNKSSSSSYDNMDQTDKSMFTELADIFKKNGEIWEGYSINNKPFLLSRVKKDQGLFRKYSYAVNIDGIHNSLNAKEVKLPENMGLPKVYRINRLGMLNIKMIVPSSFYSYKSKGKEIFNFKYYPEMIKKPVVGQSFHSFFLHESFHIFKQAKWHYDKDVNKDTIISYPNNKYQYSLLGIEGAILDKAKKTTDTSELMKLMKEWTIVREAKQKYSPQIKNEVNIEAIEGTAQYFQYCYSQLIGEHEDVINASNKKPYTVNFETAFDSVSKADNIEGIKDFFQRQIYYQTGAALLQEMDKLKIDWKSKIEDNENKTGKTQYKQLYEYFDIVNIKDKELIIDQIKRDYDYDKWEKFGVFLEEKLK